jgi:copper transport protein
VVFAAIGSVLVGTGIAFAHAELTASDPARGSENPTAPAEVSASFTEPLTESSSLQVFDACGDRVDSGGAAISGNDIKVALDSNVAGRYQVRYFVISDLDGHPSRGTFTFDVSSGTSCAGGPSGGGGSGAGGGIFDIPMGQLFLGLGLAALIGAAGGHVYAGIVGRRT